MLRPLSGFAKFYRKRTSDGSEELSDINSTKIGIADDLALLNAHQVRTLSP